MKQVLQTERNGDMLQSGNSFRRQRMPGTRYRALLGLVLFAVSLLCCSPTKFVNAWRDSSYQGHPRKVLVHSVGRNPTVRTIFENELVEQFGQHGVDALASHTFLPESAVVNREAVKRLVEAKGCDALFIAGPTNRKELESLRPGEQSYAFAIYEGQVEDYDSFNAFVNGSVHSAGTYAGEKVFTEMALYDAASKKRIWSALSRTYVWDTPVKEIKPVVSRIVEMLADENIIP
jgi:hypothetical protein